MISYNLPTEILFHLEANILTFMLPLYIWLFQMIDSMHI